MQSKLGAHSLSIANFDLARTFLGKLVLKKLFVTWMAWVVLIILVLVVATPAHARRVPKIETWKLSNGKKDLSLAASCSRFNQTLGAQWLQAGNFTNTHTWVEACNVNGVTVQSVFTQHQVSVFTPAGSTLIAPPNSGYPGYPVCDYTWNNTITISGPTDCGYSIGTFPNPGGGGYAYSSKEWVCPAGFYDAGEDCSDGAAPPAEAENKECGNPVDIAGCKVERYTFGTAESRRQFLTKLDYSGFTGVAHGAFIGDANWYLDPIDRRLDINPTQTKVIAVRSAKVSIPFNKVGGVWIPADRTYSLAQTSTGFSLYDPLNGEIDSYDPQGKLQTVSRLSGALLTVTTASGNPNAKHLTDQTGRVTQVSVLASGSRQITLASNASYSLGFGIGDFIDKISTLTNPDATSKQFLYVQSPTVISALSSGGSALDLLTNVVGPPTSGGGSPALPPDYVFGGFSTKPLIGVFDETTNQLSNFEVTPEGKTISTERAGGVGRYSFNITNGYTKVTEPLGGSYQVATTLRNDDRSVLSWIKRGNSDDSVSYTESYGYTGDALLSRQVRSFTGSVNSYNVNCYSQEPLRAIEVIRIEGRTDPDCSVLEPTLSATERKFMTQWHPDWVLRTRLSEPKKVTTWVYQGQPDPTASGAIANCLAAGASLLPNGKPYAVLCKQVEQTTSDDNGALGFLAPAVGAARVWSYTYGVDGQVLTEKGPRTDVVELTTYEYFATTDTAVPIKWWKGDLKKMINPKGQITTYDEYEPNGKVKKMTDANGLLTTYTYHVRDWLTGITRTAGGTSLSTTLEYHPTGKLKKVTNPDGSFLSYAYDAAQRLVGMSDNIGNQVAYTLDNASNRIKEEFKDPAGTLKRNIARTMDSLSRVQSVTGAAQ